MLLGGVGMNGQCCDDGRRSVNKVAALQGNGANLSKLFIFSMPTHFGFSFIASIGLTLIQDLSLDKKSQLIYHY